MRGGGGGEARCTQHGTVAKHTNGHMPGPSWHVSLGSVAKKAPITNPLSRQAVVMELSWMGEASNTHRRAERCSPTDTGVARFRRQTPAPPGSNPYIQQPPTAQRHRHQTTASVHLIPPPAQRARAPPPPPITFRRRHPSKCTHPSATRRCLERTDVVGPVRMPTCSTTFTDQS